MWWWRRPQTVIVYQRPLTEEQINAALAVDQNEPLWRAVLQLIMTAEDNAHNNAAVNMDPPTVLAGYVGGAEHLRMLRDELVDRREAGLAELGPRKREAMAE
jgi:hypothetical protein